MNEGFGRLAAAVLVALCVARGASGLDVTLEFEKYSSREDGTFRPYGGGGARFLLECPEGDWKLPEFASDSPLFALIQLGDGKRLAAIDRKTPRSDFYDVLYFDANGNGDLTDDSAIRGDGQAFSGGRYHMTEFPALETTVEAGAASLPYVFLPRVSCFVQEGEKLTPKYMAERGDLYLGVQCAYRGRFELGGQPYFVIVNDRNGNGRFNDPVSLMQVRVTGSLQPLYPQGDEVYLGESQAFDYYDGMPLSSLLVLGGRVYEVAVDVPAGKMTLTPYEQPLASLRLGMEAERLTLCSEDGTRCINMLRPGKQVMVPAGKYRLLSYQAQRNDGQGDLWRVVAMATTDTPMFEVAAGSNGTLKFGEPYVPVVSVPRRRTAPPGARVSDVPMSLNVLGRAQLDMVPLRDIRPVWVGSAAVIESAISPGQAWQ